MKKKTFVRRILALLCAALWLSAGAETRKTVIALEGMEEIITETLYESELGISFWYVDDVLEVHPGVHPGQFGGDMALFVKARRNADDRMVLMPVTEEDAAEYGEEMGIDVLAASMEGPLQADVYRKEENGRILFLTLLAQNGQYMTAAGEYGLESAEGNAKYFQKLLDTVTLISPVDAQMLKDLPGSWKEEYEGRGVELTLDQDGGMTLNGYRLDGSFAYTCQGTWSYAPGSGFNGELTLHYTRTNNPSWAGSGYDVQCVYTAYTESWVENDTEITYLILNPVSGTGTTPFADLFGTDDAALHREEGPNMRVVKCREYVSLRESRSTSSRRLARVPLGAQVLAYPELGEENGFIYCIYQDQEGYILADYLEPIE